MGLSFDILIFDCLLKTPQPVTGLFLCNFKESELETFTQTSGFCERGSDYNTRNIQFVAHLKSRLSF